MAQRNLSGAAEALDRHPGRGQELAVDAEEAAAWRDAAEAMLIPYDDELEVHPQAEQFTEHAVWDFADATEEKYPLMLHFPYFDLYRKQVVKQADLVMACCIQVPAVVVADDRFRRDDGSGPATASATERVRERRQFPRAPGSACLKGGVFSSSIFRASAARSAADEAGDRRAGGPDRMLWVEGG